MWLEKRNGRKATFMMITRIFRSQEVLRQAEYKLFTQQMIAMVTYTFNNKQKLNLRHLQDLRDNKMMMLKGKRNLRLSNFHTAHTNPDLIRLIFYIVFIHINLIYSFGFRG